MACPTRLNGTNLPAMVKNTPDIIRRMTSGSPHAMSTADAQKLSKNSKNLLSSRSDAVGYDPFALEYSSVILSSKQNAPENRNGSLNRSEPFKYW